MHAVSQATCRSNGAVLCIYTQALKSRLHEKHFDVQCHIPSILHGLFVISLYCLVRAQAECRCNNEIVQTRILLPYIQLFALTVQVCHRACYSYNIAVSRASERVLDFDGVTSVALALSTTGTLVAARAFSVLAVAAALSLASLAAGAGTIRATLAVVTTVAL